jgi:hypothetical protein
MANVPSPGALKIEASATPRAISLLAKVKGAKEVILSGVFNGWAKDRIKMQQVGPDQWRADLQLAPGEYQYRLIVDGKWQDHPEASRRIANPYGTQNCVLSVSKG